MKIAITSTGRQKGAPVDPRFGRASYFILAEVDENVTFLDVVPNTQNQQSPQGAGIQSAQTIHANKAEAVVTGHVGPKAYRALAAAGIAIYLTTGGTVQEAAEAYLSGYLTRAQSADVEGHW
jgi:predicted Fe-Mo cluster-binding NifX family protein